MMETKVDLSRYHNALSRKNQVVRMLWTIVWGVFARPLPRSVGSGWKRFLLRLFGARIDATAIVYSSAKVYYPANLRWGLCLLDLDVDCRNVINSIVSTQIKMERGNIFCWNVVACFVRKGQHR